MCPPGRDRRCRLVSAVIVLLHVIPFVNFMLDVVLPFGIMDSRRAGKANTPGTPAGKEPKPRAEEAGLGGMKAVAIRWAEQEAARKARKRPVRLVM